MGEKIKFPSSVILIDATFLNLVITDLKKYFGRTLKRELQEIDLSKLVTYLASDPSITEEEDRVQILVAYDRSPVRLSNCIPSDLSTELNGVAFKSQFGEFSFAGVPCEEMASHEKLYLDSLNIITDFADMRQLISVSFNGEYGDKVMNRLEKIKNKEAIQLRINEPEEVLEGHQREMFAYPLTQALRIRGEGL